MTLGTWRGGRRQWRGERSWELRSDAQTTGDGSAGHETDFGVSAEGAQPADTRLTFTAGVTSLSATHWQTDDDLHRLL